jgi:hypothetical protein
MGHQWDFLTSKHYVGANGIWMETANMRFSHIG